MKNARFSAAGNGYSSVNITELCWFTHTNTFVPFLSQKKKNNFYLQDRVVLCNISISHDVFAGWFISLVLQGIVLMFKDMTVALVYMLNISINDNLCPEPYTCVYVFNFNHLTLKIYPELNVSTAFITLCNNRSLAAYFYGGRA